MKTLCRREIQHFFAFRLKDELLESRRVTKGEEIFVKQLEVINNLSIDVFILIMYISMIESFVYDLSNVIENISVCKRRRGDSSNRKGRN